MSDHIATLEFVRNHTSRTSEEIASLDAAIALMRGQSWQPIDEFTPRNRAFLVWGKGMGTWIASMRDNGDWDDGDFHHSIRGLTHYSELPDPPKGHSR